MSDGKKSLSDFIGTKEDAEKYLEDQKKRLKLPLDDKRTQPDEHEDGEAEEFIKIDIVDFEKHP